MKDRGLSERGLKSHVGSARPTSRSVPMWPPILPRFTGGSGGGDSGAISYGDMEHWLPGQTAAQKKAAKSRGNKPIPNNPEFEIFEDEGERVKIEYFVYEKSCKDRLKRFFFKNKTTSWLVLIVLCLLKLITCGFYVVRVCWDRHPEVANCYQCDGAYENVTNTGSPFYGVRWWALLWVHRPLWMWASQVGIALFTLTITLLMTLLRYKGNKWELLTGNLFLELSTTIPFIVTLSWRPLVNLFIPVFLNAWQAKIYLGSIFNFGKSQSILAQQVVSVVSTLVCLIFTAMCCFEHAERSSFENSARNVNFFKSFYFIMVTLSTVGYGDIVPSVWISQILVVIVIFTALGVLPKQVEMLATTWMERQRLGGSYTKSKKGLIEKHVVLCLPTLNPETLMDFLSEFFAYRRLQDHTVVILTQDDLQPITKQIIQKNIWANKVKYIKGSCVRDIDLMRVRILDADGCFLLSIDSNYPKTVADEQTIINSWAIKDFAPHVRQFVQIFRPENKVYVDFAESAICEDEFKYAMLAYNCICPGTSALITLLLHTSRGEEGNQSNEQWIRLYGKCSGNEIYKTEMTDSLIFKEYLGKTFPYAAHHAHKKYGVTLLAVKCNHANAEDQEIKLNPGPSHIMRETDYCYYLSITREQNMNFTREKIDVAGTGTRTTSGALGKHKVGPSDNHPAFDQDDDKMPKEVVIQGPQNGLTKDVAKIANPVAGRLQFHEMKTVVEEDIEEHDDTWIEDLEKINMTIGYPPVTPYVGTSPTTCHLLTQKKDLCCIRLDEECEHCSFMTADQYNWANKPIILVVVEANNGIYNFILPLRASVLHRWSLKPIILMLENDPSDAFADAIAWFPMVYWVKGTIHSLDDLLRAGIDAADNLVVTNRDNGSEDEEIGDSRTIVTVQKLFKFFPSIKITTELSSTTMMRFLHFQPGNPFAQYLSVLEKQEREKGSQVSFMFRLQFASGNVFSASMIHTLLYQSILKDFVVTLTRLVLGIDQTQGSGFLTGRVVKPSDMDERGTYGKMFSYLSASSGSVPIAVYRTDSNIDEEKFGSKVSDPKLLAIRKIEEKEIRDIMKSRMAALNLGTDNYQHGEETGNKVNYVIINPHVEMPLEVGDFVYYLRPPPDRMSKPSSSASGSATSRLEDVDSVVRKLGSKIENKPYNRKIYVFSAF